MAKILVADGMDRNAAKELTNMGHELVIEHLDVPELKKELGDYDVIIIRSATKIRKEVIDAVVGSNLKLIIRAGVGLDNIDVSYAREKGIAVENTPKASSASVAELTIAHMFSLSRFLYISNVTMRDGMWYKKAYKGIELSGKTLGLIGFGRIAIEVAKKASALGMKVIYTDIITKDGYDEFSCVTKEEVLKTSDFISLHIPFIKEIGPVLNENEFNMMKDGVYIVNCARGGVVNEEALIKALDSGKVAGAAIDVFEEEPTKNKKLFTHEKVSLTPHIGASTKEAQSRIGLEIIDKVKEYF
ncbi:D-2-hydroxyacid dehydrogenase [Vallitalea sediminicola]